jgi:outer membrane lipoprotein-sorting protein
MKTILHPNPLTVCQSALLALALLILPGQAQEAAPTAPELARRLSTALQDGSSAVRLKLEMKAAAGAPKSVLQLQIKSRRTPASTEVLYQVLWPKERKGESFLLRKSGHQAASGTVFVPPANTQSLSASQMQEGIFGSDLAYEDLVDNFYGWESQTLAGTETVDRVLCQILESKPGKGERSSYARVRSWIDPKKMVPLRIEKYAASGQVARRIDTTRVSKDDAGRSVPSTFSVVRGGQASVTELEGSNSRHDVSFTDADFSPEALKTITPAK